MSIPEPIRRLMKEGKVKLASEMKVEPGGRSRAASPLRRINRNRPKSLPTFCA